MKYKLYRLMALIVAVCVLVSGATLMFQAEEPEPESLGTYEDGYSKEELAGKENATLAAGIFSELQNFDFSEGLVNWTSRDFEYASKYAQPKEENGKTYVTLTASDYQGIGSMGFRLEDVEPGDVLALMADFRGDSKLQLKLEHANYTCASEDGLVRTNGAKVVYPASDEKGWSTAVSETSMVLSDYSKDDNSIARFGDGFVFYVRVQSQDTQVVTDITNIRVVKVLEDGSYTELDGTPIVFYDEYGDVYDPDAGTREDGFTTSNGNTIGRKPLVGLGNGDFSMGLKNWAATGSSGGFASKRATPKTEGDKSFITLTSEGGYEGIVSRPFYIEGIEPGDKLALMAEYRGDSKLQLVLEHINPTDYSNQRANGIKILYPAKDPNNWSMGVSSTNVVVTPYNTDPSSVATYGEGYYFIARVQSQDTPVTSDIANVRVVKVLDDGSYETLDGEPIIIRDEDGDVYDPDAGTRDDGFVVSNGDVISLGAIPEFANGDFSSGLKYWTAWDGKAASTMATPKTEGDKSYITLNSPGNYVGIKSRPFRIEGVEVGDVLAVMVDYRGDEKLQLVLEYPNNTDHDTSRANNSSTVYTSKEENGWNTAVSAQKVTVSPYNDAPGYVQRYGDDFFFYISLQSQDTPIVTDIANVRVVKVLEDGSFETVDGEPIVFYDEDGDIYDPNAGTRSDGFTVGGGDVVSLGALPELANGDFRFGLKYWTAWDGKPASTFASPKTDADRSYITLKSAGDYKGIRSRAFRIKGIEPGDTLAVMVDYRGDAKLQLVLEYPNATDYSTNRANGISTVYTSSSPNGWNTGVSAQKVKVSPYATDSGSLSKYGDDYMFFVCLQSQDTPIESDISNVRIVKELEDGSFETVEGEPIVFYDEDGDVYDPNAGTSKDGFTTDNGNVIGRKPLIGLGNGDFSNGLKNWTATGNPGGYASKRATPKAEGGKTFITLKSEGNYEGIVSRPFYLEGIKPGDTLALMADYRGDSKLQLVLEHINPTDYTNSRANGIKMIFTATDPNNWSTGVSQTNVVVTPYNTDPSSIATYGEGYYFIARVQSQDTPITSDITNVRVVKINDDGSYSTITGQPIVFYDEDGEIYDPNSGTRKNGIVTGGNYAIYSWPYVDEFKNGSFNEGFKYWATVDGVSPTQYATLGQDPDGRNFITLKAADYRGLISQPFHIKNVKWSDKIVVMIDYRGDGNLQLCVEITNRDGTGNENRVLGMKTIYESDNWNTAVVSPALTVGNMKTDAETVAKYGTEPYFTIRLSAGAGETITDISNVRVLKLADDGKYYNLDGTLADYKTGSDIEGGVDLPELETRSSDLRTQTLKIGKVSKEIPIGGNTLNAVIIVLSAVLAVAVIAGAVLLVLNISKQKTNKKAP